MTRWCSWSRRKIAGNFLKRRRHSLMVLFSLHGTLIPQVTFHEDFVLLFPAVRPGSNAVLHMSRTQFNQSGSCKVWTGWGILHAWPAVNNTFGSNADLHMSRTKHVRSKGAIFTLPWKTTTDQQDRFSYLFGIAVRVDWEKFDVWLKQALFWLFESTQTVIWLGLCEVQHLTRASWSDANVASH